MDRERLISRPSHLTPSSGNLSNTSAAGDALGPPPKVKWTDLPNKPQLFLLALCRLSEPLSNVCLLPYIFHLVRSVLPRSDASNHTDPSTATTADAARISQASGLLIATFPLAQFLLSLPISYLSDRHGRRIPILLGLFLSTISNAAFGFSKSLPALFLWRAIAGAANANVGIMRGTTAEIVREKKYQTKAFLLLPLVFNSGMVASLALGGLLADPVRSMPWAFGKHGFLNLDGGDEGVWWAVEFPYALPGVLNAAILGTALVVSWLWLRETLPGKEGTVDAGLRLGDLLLRLHRKILSTQSAEYIPSPRSQPVASPSARSSHQES